MSLRLADDGTLLVYSFAGDSRADCLAWLGAAQALEEPFSPGAEPAEAREPLAIWRAARAPDRAVVRYLASRGIKVPIPRSIRQAQSLGRGGVPRPTMVAAVQAPDRRIIAVQELRLTERGTKASVAVPRFTTGRLHAGAARLAAPAERMGLAEGIETALAAMQLSGIPAWASLGAQRLPKVWLPSEVRELTIFADADETGMAMAEKAAERHRGRGLAVTVSAPERGDWADVVERTG